MRVVDSAEVAARYQRAPRLSRRTRIALGALGVVGLTVAVSAVAWPAANPPIDTGVLRSDVLSDHSVRLVFQVDKAPGRAAVCTIHALDADGSEVGRRDVPIPADPGGSRQTTQTVTVQTSGRAIVAEVEDCNLTG